jgi:uncharacterized protein (DUF4415 family)
VASANAKPGSSNEFLKALRRLQKKHAIFDKEAILLLRPKKKRGRPPLQISVGQVVNAKYLQRDIIGFLRRLNKHYQKGMNKTNNADTLLKQLRSRCQKDGLLFPQDQWDTIAQTLKSSRRLNPAKAAAKLSAASLYPRASRLARAIESRLNKRALFPQLKPLLK